MKKIYIGSILLLLTLAAFGQSRAGAVGITAKVGYNTASIGFEVNPTASLIVRPDFNFSLTNSTKASNNQALNTPKREEKTDTMTFGGNLAILYTVMKAGQIELSVGPKGGISVRNTKWRLPVLENIGPTEKVSYDYQVYSYGAGIIGNVKFFLTERFAFYSYLGLRFNTSYTKFSNHKTASGGKPNYPTTGDSNYGFIDSSSYGFSMETPTVGAIFYLK